MLAHLLLNKKVDYDISQDHDYQNWVIRLIDKLRDRPDVLTEYILQTRKNEIRPALERALEYVTDGEQLFRIAASASYLPVSWGAMKRLTLDVMPRLEQEAKDMSVSQYAGAQWRRLRIASADDGELLMIIQWLLQYSSDRRDELLEMSVTRLESQEAMLSAIRILLPSNLSLCRLLLPRITDSEGLMELYLSEKLWWDACRRLRELISGSPLEDQFVAEATKQQKFSHLSVYFDISEEKAIWKYGGEVYIRRLMEQLNNTRERDKAREIVSQLASIYRSIPESKPILSPIQGKRYHKHVDQTGYYCVTEISHTEDFVVDLERK